MGYGAARMRIISQAAFAASRGGERARVVSGVAAWSECGGQAIRHRAAVGGPAWLPLPEAAGRPWNC